MCAPELEREFAPLRTGKSIAGNLPRQVTTFVGRDDEVKNLAAAVTESPLVTLTGVGGVGKTRLALEVAAVAADDFPDGAWLCELAAVTDPSAVWDALAATFRIVPPPARRLEDVLTESLARKRALVVLDNCEHLLDGVAAAVLVLGRACPGLTILATSREGLALPGEQIVAVPSLALPHVGASEEVIITSPSVRLFCDRARSAKHDFVADAAGLETVGQLCRRLDGIPLAIELAAARVGSLSAEDLLARLDERFRLLTRGNRASLERHQTLRNTIDWSYDLLDDAERQALQRLAVFAGGGDLAALEAVLSAGEAVDRFDVVDVVSMLVNKSLVVAEVEEGGRIRYRMLETIRQYAQERLEASGDLNTARRAHAEHCVAFAESAAARPPAVASCQFGRDVSSVRSTTFELPSTGLSTAGARTSHCDLLRRSSVMAMPRATPQRNGPTPRSTSPEPKNSHSSSRWPRGRCSAQRCARTSNGRPPMRRKSSGSRTESDDLIPLPTGALGLWPSSRAMSLAQRHFSEAWVETARAADDGYQLAHALVLHAATGQIVGLPTARVLMEEAVVVARDTGTLSALSLALSALVGMLDLDTESELALALTQEAIAVASDVGDHVSMTVAGSTQAFLLAKQGDYHAALALVRVAADELIRSNSVLAIVPLCWATVSTLVGFGEHDSATVLLGKAQGGMGTSAGLWIGEHETMEATLRAVRAGEFQADFERGAAMSAIEAATFIINLDTAAVE